MTCYRWAPALVVAALAVAAPLEPTTATLPPPWAIVPLLLLLVAVVGSLMVLLLLLVVTTVRTPRGIVPWRPPPRARAITRARAVARARARARAVAAALRVLEREPVPTHTILMPLLLLLLLRGSPAAHFLLQLLPHLLSQIMQFPRGQLTGYGRPPPSIAPPRPPFITASLLPRRRAGVTPPGWRGVRGLLLARWGAQTDARLRCSVTSAATTRHCRRFHVSTSPSGVAAGTCCCCCWRGRLVAPAAAGCALLFPGAQPTGGVADSCSCTGGLGRRLSAAHPPCCIWQDIIRFVIHKIFLICLLLLAAGAPHSRSCGCHCSNLGGLGCFSSIHNRPLPSRCCFACPRLRCSCCHPCR